MKKDALKRLRSASLNDDLGFLLARARTIWTARDNGAFAEFGLRGRTYSVLALATAGLHPTQRELADFLCLDTSQIVALVDSLEEAGLVVRETSTTDRRTNAIVATPKGVRLHARARKAALAAEGAAKVDLTADERETLITLLGKIAF